MKGKIVMFNSNLKKLRKACGFKQDDVAKVLGVDRSAYSYYEGGKTEPNISNLIKIARMFKVDVDTVVGNSEYTQALELESEPGADYDSGIAADISVLERCSADERLLIAWYRQMENKKEILELVKSQYDLQCSKDEE